MEEVSNGSKPVAAAVAGYRPNWHII